MIGGNTAQIINAVPGDFDSLVNTGVGLFGGIDGKWLAHPNAISREIGRIFPGSE